LKRKVTNLQEEQEKISYTLDKVSESILREKSDSCTLFSTQTTEKALQKIAKKREERSQEDASPTQRKTGQRKLCYSHSKYHWLN